MHLGKYINTRRSIQSDKNIHTHTFRSNHVFPNDKKTVLNQNSRRYNHKKSTVKSLERQNCIYQNLYFRMESYTSPFNEFCSMC